MSLRIEIYCAALLLACAGRSPGKLYRVGSQGISRRFQPTRLRSSTNYPQLITAPSRAYPLSQRH